MRAIRGTLITPFETIRDGQIEYNGAEITYSGPSRPFEGDITEYGTSLIAPGLIDIHVHGGNGYDAMDTEPEALERVSLYLSEGGVTSFLATTQTASKEETNEALKRIAKNVNKTNGANLLGSHLEGPFISEKRKGAQHKYIHHPSTEELRELMEASDHTLKLVTLAPEIEGGIEAAKWLAEQGVLVSAGHTDATYSEAVEAFDAGIMQLSHFYNGMRGFHHREPSIVGAALMDERVKVELIADCLHVHPAVLMFTVQVKGVEKIILVSDSIKPAGLPDGDYTVHDRQLILQNGLVRLPSGVIAGSSIKLCDAVKNMVSHANVSITEAVQMATINPAIALGLGKKGKLAQGYDADIVIMSENFSIIETTVGGITVYSEENRG